MRNSTLLHANNKGTDRPAHPRSQFTLESMLHAKNEDSVVPRSRFLGDTSVPLPEFLWDICKFWGTHQFHLIFACKIENSFPEISVHFYLHLSSMSIVLAQEGVQITVK